MKNITKVRLNNTCINIDRIDLAQRMEKGSVLLRFGETASNLRDAIDRLIDSDLGDATTLKLLAAIAKCPIWDEQSDREFRRLGFSVALEIYDLMTMNADFGFAIDDPNNPRNWDGYLADGERTAMTFKPMA